jgi:uncharacterized membrane protein YoaK (UPF0700 family)
LRDIFNSAKPAESRQLACALTFCGGFIDTYTYIQRGTHIIRWSNRERNIL